VTQQGFASHCANRVLGCQTTPSVLPSAGILTGNSLARCRSGCRGMRACHRRCPASRGPSASLTAMTRCIFHVPPQTLRRLLTAVHSQLSQKRVQAELVPKPLLDFPTFPCATVEACTPACCGARLQPRPQDDERAGRRRRRRRLHAVHQGRRQLPLAAHMDFPCC
jgi:hypothetical protein